MALDPTWHLGGRQVSRSIGVGSEEEVAEGLAHLKGKPAPAAMFGPVVQHVTALAERFQVAQPVVGGIVVEVGGRQHDTRRPGHAIIRHDQMVQGPTAPIAPYLGVLVPPAPVTKMADLAPVRPPTGLAVPLGAIEPHYGGQLRPIHRVEPLEVGSDWHGERA